MSVVVIFSLVYNGSSIFGFAMERSTTVRKLLRFGKFLRYWWLLAVFLTRIFWFLGIILGIFVVGAITKMVLLFERVLPMSARRR